MKIWGIIIAVLMLNISGLQAAETALVSPDDIMSAVKKEFVEEGVDETIELEVFGGQTSFAIEGAQSTRIMVSNLKYDEEQNKFSAQAEIFADGKSYAKTVLNGRYYLVENVWAPADDIEKGTILKEDMFKKIKVRKNRIKSNHIVDMEKLKNTEAKKSLKAGKLITDRDIGDVVVIKKGKIVTSVYKSKGLQITTKAEALEDGVVGRRIEMMNIKSGKKFTAEVKGAELVEIDD